MQFTRTRKEEFFGICLIMLFLSLLFPFLPGHEADMWCWRNWSSYIHEHGLPYAYGSGSNYLPLYQYFLWAFGKLAGSEEKIVQHIGYIRTFTLAFDIAGLYLVYRWIGRSYSFLLLVLLNIFNVAYSYNTIIWGQVDGIMTTLVFASLFFASRKQFALSSIMMVLAINMKLQAIIFVPIWALLILQFMWREKNLKILPKILFILLLVQIIIVLPFWLKGNLGSIWRVVTESVGQYPTISMNAFNFWYLVVPGNLSEINDTAGFIGGLSYKTTGLILFFVSSGLVLLPILLGIFRKGGTAFSHEKIWLASALIAILFFYFNTQMHERYCHPAFLFLAAYSFKTRNFIPYIMFGLAYFLNMEKVLEFLQLDDYELLIFNPSFVSVLFLSALFYISWTYYRLFRNSGRVANQEVII